MKVAYRVLLAAWILFVIYLMISFAVDPEATMFAIVFVFGTMAVVWWVLSIIEKVIRSWLK